MRVAWAGYFESTRLNNVLRVFALPLLLAVLNATLLIGVGHDVPAWLYYIGYAQLACTTATLWVEFQAMLRHAAVWRLMLGSGAAVGAGVAGWLTTEPSLNFILLWVLFGAVYVIPSIGRGKTTPDFAAWLHQAVHLQIMALLANLLLIAGLNLALFSLQQVFGITIPGSVYLNLNIALYMVGVPLLWFVLLPDLRNMPVQLVITRAQRILNSYILLPLFWLLLAIGYLYIGKALITRTLITEPVLLFALAGLCAVGPLLHAMLYCQRECGTWLERAYVRWLFLLILPPAGAVGAYLAHNIQAHGFTPLRYWGMLMLLWLGGTAIYFAVSRPARYRFQHAALGWLLVMLVAAYGPWMPGKDKSPSAIRPSAVPLPPSATDPRSLPPTGRVNPQPEVPGSWRDQSLPPEQRSLRTLFGGTEDGGLNHQFSRDRLVIHESVATGSYPRNADVWPDFRGIRIHLDGNRLVFERENAEMIGFDLSDYIARLKASPPQTRSEHSQMVLATKPENKRIEENILVRKQGPWTGTLVIHFAEINLMPDGTARFDNLGFSLLLEKSK